MTRRTAARLAAWLTLAVSFLAVGLLDRDTPDGYCGVWGCYPPWTALVGMHGFQATALGAGS